MQRKLLCGSTYIMEKLVLVAEDDEIIYESIESSLAREGIKAIHCKDGHSAVEFFFKNPVPVVLTDLRMPGMSGNELVERLLSAHPRPIILIQSVVDDIQLILGYMKRGVYDYIIKPYSLQELAIRIKKAFELSELLEYKARTQNFEEHNPFNGNSPALALKNFDTTINNILTKYYKNGEGLYLEELTYLKFKKIYDDFSSILWAIERLASFNKIPNENDQVPITNVLYILERAENQLEKYLALKNQNFSINSFPQLQQPNQILLDTESFYTVLVELILNAMKFGEKHSTIFVRLSSKEKNYLEIEVENLIPRNFYLPDILDLLFEPFYLTQLEEHLGFPTANIGLGLTLVRKIITNHKGEVRVFLKENSTSQERKVCVQLRIPLTN